MDNESMKLADFFSKLQFKIDMRYFFLLLFSPLLIGFTSVGQANLPQYTLESGQWHQLVIPGDSSTVSVANFFSDVLLAEQYNASWVIYRWDNIAAEYVNPGLNGSLATGEGFWIVQVTGESVTLDVANLAQAQPIFSSACPSVAGCTEINTFSETSTSRFSMIGSAQGSAQSIKSLVFIAPAIDGECANGCSHPAATDAGLVESTIYHYNPDTETYDDLNDIGFLNPWESAWFQRSADQFGIAANYLFPLITAESRLAFTDLTAAPNGAAVSLFGTDVDGPLIVGGMAMTNCPYINETVYQVPESGVRLAKTTCWLEGLQQGATTIKAGGSSELPFTVNNASVSTLTSYAEFDAAMDDPEPGTVFLLKGFTTDLAVDGRINGGKQTLWMRPGEHDGTELMPIALVGYPGDPAKFVVSSANVNANRSISLQNNWWIISNLDFDTVWSAIAVSGQSRVVGNRIKGMTGPKFGSGTGTIVAGGETKGGFILGNTIFGGASNWRFDHAIYISDCPDEQGWVVDWNYIYDNNFARGPQIIINHQPPRCGTGLENKSLASHFVRHNTVDTSFYRGRCIGVNSFGWDYTSNPVAPEWSYIENNDLIECGFVGSENDMFGDSRGGAAIHIARGRVFVQRNRLVRAHDGISIGHVGSGVVNDLLGVVVKSNQIDLELGDAIIINSAISDRVTLDNNIVGPIQF